MNEELVYIFLFMSRLPLYAFVIWKMWRYRHSMIVIPSRWLGLTAVFAVLGATLSVFTEAPLVGSAIGYLFSLSLFYTAYVSKQVKSSNIKDIME